VNYVSGEPFLVISLSRFLWRSSPLLIFSREKGERGGKGGKSRKGEEKKERKVKRKPDAKLTPPIAPTTPIFPFFFCTRREGGEGRGERRGRVQPPEILRPRLARQCVFIKTAIRRQSCADLCIRADQRKGRGGGKRGEKKKELHAHPALPADDVNRPPSFIGFLMILVHGRRKKKGRERGGKGGEGRRGGKGASGRVAAPTTARNRDGRDLRVMRFPPFVFVFFLEGEGGGGKGGEEEREKVICMIEAAPVLARGLIILFFMFSPFRDRTEGGKKKKKGEKKEGEEGEGRRI